MSKQEETEEKVEVEVLSPEKRMENLEVEIKNLATSFNHFQKTLLGDKDEKGNPVPGEIQRVTEHYLEIYHSKVIQPLLKQPEQQKQVEQKAQQGSGGGIGDFIGGLIGNFLQNPQQALALLNSGTNEAGKIVIDVSDIINTEIKHRMNLGIKKGVRQGLAEMGFAPAPALSMTDNKVTGGMKIE